jgi:two-component system chemotaxis response regulator CheB
VKAQPIDFLAIGASAGGFEAIGRLLPSLKGFQGMVAMVLHIPADRDSPLSSTLQLRSPLPVKEAEDKEVMCPGTIYVAPRDYHLLVNPGGELSLDVGDPENYSRPSIDALFESAAFVYGKRMAAVLLTGANADGAAGLRIVAERGGLTAVESPESARFPQMPAAALELLQPSAVLPLEQLSQWLETELLGMGGSLER